MKHKINFKLGGQIVGTGEVSDSGEVVSSNVDESKIPEQFRPGFDPVKHVSFSDDEHGPEDYKNFAN